MNATSAIPPAAGSDSPLTREIDASCRVPLFLLFAKSAAWLVVASIFGLLASLRFHSPELLAGHAWLCV